MGYDYIWRNANPEYDEYLRIAQRARAATYHAAWKRCLGVAAAIVEWFTEAHRRAHRARSTYRQLHALDERELKDLGLPRGEIDLVAKAVAAASPDAPVRLVDLRGVVRVTAASETTGPFPLRDVGLHKATVSRSLFKEARRALRTDRTPRFRLVGGKRQPVTSSNIKET